MIKKVIKLFSTSCRRVSSRGLREQSGGWGGKGRIGEVWNPGTTFSQLAIKRMLVSGIFEQMRTFVVVPDVLSKFSKTENLFFFRGSVRCQHQLKLYSFERD